MKVSAERSCFTSAAMFGVVKIILYIYYIIDLYVAFFGITVSVLPLISIVPHEAVPEVSKGKHI